MKLTDTQKIDFIKKAAFIANSSTCGYKIGCVGVIEDIGQIISEEAEKDPNYRRKNGFIYLKTWNETLPGEIYCQNCDDKGDKLCIRKIESLKGRDFQKVCSIHAEQNLIAKCARYGIKTKGMIIFITNTPCYICAKSIIQAGVKTIYYISEHTDTIGKDLLSKNKIELLKSRF